MHGPKRQQVTGAWRKWHKL